MADNQLPASFAPRTLEEAMSFAKILAESDFVPDQYKKKPGNILAAMQFGAEVGLAPLQALQNIAVINGRPSMWGDAMLALVKRSGLLEEFSETDNGQVAICISKRKGGFRVESRFSVEDARRAGLDKKGTHQQYPARMRQMRARGFNLRDNFPDVLKGLIMQEEAQDYDLDITKDEPAVTVTSVADHLDNPEPLTPEVTNLKLVPDEPVDEEPIGDDSADYADIMLLKKELKLTTSEICALAEANFGANGPEQLRPSQVTAFVKEMQRLRATE